MRIPQEKSHQSSDGGGAIDGVVVGVRDVDPAPGVHTEQSDDNGGSGSGGSLGVGIIIFSG